MEKGKLLERYEFVETDVNEFTRDEWTVRFDGHEFEVFADPEIDTRYYHGMIDNLERVLRVL